MSSTTIEQIIDGELVDLARALAVDRPPGFAGVGFESDQGMPQVLACPRCQRRAVAATPAACSLDGESWWCARCRRRGTRRGLAGRVIDDPSALARFDRRSRR